VRLLQKQEEKSTPAGRDLPESILALHELLFTHQHQNEDHDREQEPQSVRDQGQRAGRIVGAVRDLGQSLAAAVAAKRAAKTFLQRRYLQALLQSMISLLKVKVDTDFAGDHLAAQAALHETLLLAINFMATVPIKCFPLEVVTTTPSSSLPSSSSSSSPPLASHLVWNLAVLLVFHATLPESSEAERSLASTYKSTLCVWALGNMAARWSWIQGRLKDVRAHLVIAQLLCTSIKAVSSCEVSNPIERDLAQEETATTAVQISAWALGNIFLGRWKAVVAITAVEGLSQALIDFLHVTARAVAEESSSFSSSSSFCHKEPIRSRSRSSALLSRIIAAGVDVAWLSSWLIGGDDYGAFVQSFTAFGAVNAINKCLGAILSLDTRDSSSSGTSCSSIPAPVRLLVTPLARCVAGITSKTVESTVLTLFDGDRNGEEEEEEEEGGQGMIALTGRRSKFNNVRGSGSITARYILELMRRFMRSGASAAPPEDVVWALLTLTGVPFGKGLAALSCPETDNEKEERPVEAIAWELLLQGGKRDLVAQQAALMICNLLVGGGGQAREERTPPVLSTQLERLRRVADGGLRAVLRRSLTLVLATLHKDGEQSEEDIKRDDGMEDDEPCVRPSTQNPATSSSTSSVTEDDDDDMDETEDSMLTKKRREHLDDTEMLRKAPAYLALLLFHGLGTSSQSETELSVGLIRALQMDVAQVAVVQKGYRYLIKIVNDAQREGNCGSDTVQAFLNATASDNRHS